MSSSTTRTRSTPLVFRVRSQDRLPKAAPSMPWLAAAAGAAGVSGLVGWSLAVATVALGWLAGPTAEFSDAMQFGTSVWLLGHGITTPGWSLVPLSLTLAVGLLLAWTTGYAVRSRSDRRHVHTAAGDAESPLRSAAVVWAVVVGVYGAVVVSVALLTGYAWSGQLLGGFGLAVIAAGVGAIRAIPVSAIGVSPLWRPLFVAVPTAVLVPAVVGAVGLAWTLLADRAQVAGLAEGSELSGLASAALIAAQLAFAVNAVIWAASYSLGAGFSLGDGSVVAPSGTELGLLPGIPLFGAIPAEGVSPIFAMAWFAVAAAAGVAAAVVTAGQRPEASLSESIGISALSGLLAGLIWVGLGWISSGDLGTGRLVDLGPRLPELLAYAPGSMALAGAVCAMLIVGVRTSRQPPPTG